MIVFLCLCFLTEVQAQGVRFEKKPWKEVLEQARVEKKLIFLDCYTSWCQPCKQMEREVFPVAKVGEFFNHHFVSVALDMEKGEGPVLAKIYQPNSYPFYYVLNADGDIVYQFGGFHKPEQLIGQARKALDSKTVTPVKKIEAFGLQPGDPAPDFSYSDMDGKKVSLSDLKGKYVYIDFWATWCGPCCGEIQPLMELEEALRDKNIYFVSISCDKDVEKWKAKVKEEEMGGIQLNTGGDREFMKAFAIKGIPRFVLIDPQGRVVNPDMTRPSQQVTLETLKNLK